MATYRLTLEYDGTRYHGWQEQRNARSVAGELRHAVVEAGADVLELGGAGRTDAGVHALAQTAHLKLRGEARPEALRRAVNDALPADIHLLAMTRVADSFHARHDALARVYLYQISRRRTAHAKRYVWWVKRPLQAEEMREAAALLRGRHDFRLMCERPADQTSTRVELSAAEVAESGALVLVRLTASHFLWKMVRRLVGVLVRVGTGECGRADLEGLLAGRLPATASEGIAKWTAPAAGLFLERVVYAGDSAPASIEPATPVPAEPIVVASDAAESAPVGPSFGQPLRVPPRSSLSSTRRAGDSGPARGIRAGGGASGRRRRGRGR